MPKKGRRKQGGGQRQAAANRCGRGRGTLAALADRIEKEGLKGMTLEEQNDIIQTLSATPGQENLLELVLRLQFGEAPYCDEFSEAYSEAVNASDRQGVRQAANRYWSMFEQASEFGKWGPGRVQILALTVVVLLGNYKEQNGGEHFDVGRKDVERLKELFQDERELTVIRLIAAETLAYMPDSVMLFIEEKLEICREALELEPSREEEQRRFVLYPSGALGLTPAEAQNGDRKFQTGRQIASILEIIKKNKQQIKSMMEGILKSVFQEIVPLNVDEELFFRTNLVGGCSCDYCFTKVGDLGVTKLKFCSRCQNSYYCDAECQLKAWKEGHKLACRPVGDVRPGDLMHLVGLKHNPNLNGRLVKVAQNVNDTERCLVQLYARLKPEDDTSKLFRVKTKSLKHIRPARQANIDRSTDTLTSVVETRIVQPDIRSAADTWATMKDGTSFFSAGREVSFRTLYARLFQQLQRQQEYTAQMTVEIVHELVYRYVAYNGSSLTDAQLLAIRSLVEEHHKPECRVFVEWLGHEL